MFSARKFPPPVADPDGKGRIHRSTLQQSRHVHSQHSITVRNVLIVTLHETTSKLLQNLLKRKKIANVWTWSHPKETTFFRK